MRSLVVLSRVCAHAVWLASSFAAAATPSSSTARDAATAARATFRRVDPRPDPVHGRPLARSSHGVSVVAGRRDDDRVLVYGGEHVARTPIEDGLLWIAERGDNGDEWRWSARSSASAPPPRVGHAQAVVRDRYVYVFGGRSGVDWGETTLGDLWRLDAETMEWTELAPPPKATASWPAPRSFHVLVGVGDSLYLFGGCGEDGRLADLHEYDTRTETWTDHGSCPGLRGRGGASLVALSDAELAVVGGFRGEESGEIALFDTVAKRWKGPPTDDGAIRPRSVCVHGSVPFLRGRGGRRRGLVFGGEVDPSEKGHDGAGGFADDLLLLTRNDDDDANADAVSVESVVRPSDEREWPECRGWSHGDVRANRLWFFGGLTGDDENPKRLDDLWMCVVNDDDESQQ